MKRSLILPTVALALCMVLLSMTASGSTHIAVAEEPRLPVSAPLPRTASIAYALEVTETGDADAQEATVAPAKVDAMYYTEEEVIMAAKLLYRECRGVASDTEKACVIWTVCNRVDSDEFEGETIAEVMTAKDQFAYYYDTPVWDELYDLALDVLSRWNAERNGETSSGRVLPQGYTYYTGDGEHNWFRNGYKQNYTIWDYSLASPYES